MEPPGRLEITLTREEFAERLKTELTPEKVSVWPETSARVVEAAALRALGLRIVDSARPADREHWVDLIDRGALVHVVEEDDGGWSVMLGD
jgi:hypothetical protein